MSRLQNLCLSSAPRKSFDILALYKSDYYYYYYIAVASRLISLGAAFRDTLTVVVPEK